MSRTNFLAHILKQIVNIAGGNFIDYVITCGYGLREIREVTDIDVMVTTKLYNSLKHMSCLKSCKSKITGNDRLFISFPHLGNGAEIEFFDGEHIGFPSKIMTVSYCHQNNIIIQDPFGNPYLNPIATARFYSGSYFKNNKIMIGDDIPITKERLKKNINHLKCMSQHFLQYKPTIDSFLERELFTLNSL